MTRSLEHVTLLVRDYDEAIRYFTNQLGWDLLADVPQGPDKRWVLVGPPDSRGASLLLARATTPAQEACIGRQTGGRVFLFLHTDDFSRDYETMKANRVKFVEEPRHEPYGTVVVFEDLYGNRWDLVQSREPAR